MKNILKNTSYSAYKGIVFGTFFWLTVFSVAYAASITSTTDPTVSNWDSITASWYQDVNDKLGGISVSGGNVGIGITTPDTPLFVASDSNTEVRIKSKDWTLNSAINVWNGDWPCYQLNANGTSNTGFFDGTPLAWKTQLRGCGNSTNDWIIIHTSNANSPVIIWTNNTERMRIDTNGNVWIWTTIPGYKLEVNWAWKFEDTWIWETWDVTAWANIRMWWQWRIDSESNLMFHVWGSQRLYIKNTGNVWIWTNAPTEKLEVNGNVKVKNIYSEKYNISSSLANTWITVPCTNDWNSHSAYSIVIKGRGDWNTYRTSMVNYVDSSYNWSYVETVTAAHYNNMPNYNYQIYWNWTSTHYLQVSVNTTNVNWDFTCLKLY